MTTTTATPSATFDALSMSPLERWTRVFQALGHIMKNPEETERVLELSILANAGSLPRRMHLWFEDADGRRLFEEQRAIDSRTIDLDVLGALPAGTLGRAYADFLRSRGLTPDVFDGSPSEVSDPQMAYIHQRMRQTHDLWHVLTGYDTDPASEIALQAFTFGQTGAPSTFLLAFAGTLRGSLEYPRLALDVLAAYRAGRRATKLGTFLWEDHWHMPLVELRRWLGVRTPPLEASNSIAGSTASAAAARRVFRRVDAPWLARANA